MNSEFRYSHFEDEGSEAAYYENETRDDFLPGERIGAPIARSRTKAVRRVVFNLALLCGAGIAVFGKPVTLPDWASAAISSASEIYARYAATPVEVPTAAQLSQNNTPTRSANAGEAQPAPLSSPPATSLTAAPPTAPASVVAPLQPAEKVVVAAPEPPPIAQVKAVEDPLKARAEAVGLHPDISRAVLERLSNTDFRNAGVAVKTALAQTSDEAVIVWPKQRKGQQALFEVHFVAGAAPDCRRYVVTVTKDRWLTTALPMEKCGSEANRTRRG